MRRSHKSRFLQIAPVQERIILNCTYLYRKLFYLCEIYVLQTDAILLRVRTTSNKGYRELISMRRVFRVLVTMKLVLQSLMSRWMNLLKIQMILLTFSENFIVWKENSGFLYIFPTLWGERLWHYLVIVLLMADRESEISSKTIFIHSILNKLVLS